MSTCAFCDQEKTLRDSHIIPAFVFKWQKRTGGTQFLRSSSIPNKRVQDGIKLKLLCQDCESMFGIYEKKFSEQLFIPFTSEQISNVRYSEWLARFCCSLSWRLLAMLIRHENYSPSNHPWNGDIQQAMSVWKGFLDGRKDNPGKFEQHLIFFPAVTESIGSNTPKNINRYLSRTVECDFIHTAEFCATYCKMGPFMLFGYVKPYPLKWVGTRVCAGSGIFPPRKSELPIQLLEYLFERATKQQALQSNLSPSQKELIEREIVNNLGRFSESDQFRAMLRDAELFGIDSITSSS